MAGKIQHMIRHANRQYYNIEQLLSSIRRKQDPFFTLTGSKQGRKDPVPGKTRKGPPETKTKRQ